MRTRRVVDSDEDDNNNSNNDDDDEHDDDKGNDGAVSLPQLCRYASIAATPTATAATAAAALRPTPSPPILVTCVPHSQGSSVDGLAAHTTTTAATAAATAAAMTNTSALTAAAPAVASSTSSSSYLSFLSFTRASPTTPPPLHVAHVVFSTPDTAGGVSDAAQSRWRSLAAAGHVWRNETESRSSTLSLSACSVHSIGSNNNNNNNYHHSGVDAMAAHAGATTTAVAATTAAVAGCGGGRGRSSGIAQPLYARGNGTAHALAAALFAPVAAGTRVVLSARGCRHWLWWLDAMAAEALPPVRCVTRHGLVGVVVREVGAACVLVRFALPTAMWQEQLRLYARVATAAAEAAGEEGCADAFGAYTRSCTRPYALPSQQQQQQQQQEEEQQQQQQHVMHNRSHSRTHRSHHNTDSDDDGSGGDDDADDSSSSSAVARRVRAASADNPLHTHASASNSTSEHDSSGGGHANTTTMTTTRRRGTAPATASSSRHDTDVHTATTTMPVAQHSNNDDDDVCTVAVALPRECCVPLQRRVLRHRATALLRAVRSGDYAAAVQLIDEAERSYSNNNNNVDAHTIAAVTQPTDESNSDNDDKMLIAMTDEYADDAAVTAARARTAVALLCALRGVLCFVVGDVEACVCNAARALRRVSSCADARQLLLLALLLRGAVSAARALSWHTPATVVSPWLCLQRCACVRAAYASWLPSYDTPINNSNNKNKTNKKSSSSSSGGDGHVTAAWSLSTTAPPPPLYVAPRGVVVCATNVASPVVQAAAQSLFLYAQRTVVDDAALLRVAAATTSTLTHSFEDKSVDDMRCCVRCAHASRMHYLSRQLRLRTHRKCAAQRSLFREHVALQLPLYDGSSSSRGEGRQQQQQQQMHTTTRCAHCSVALSSSDKGARVSCACGVVYCSSRCFAAALLCYHGVECDAAVKDADIQSSSSSSNNDSDDDAAAATALLCALRAAFAEYARCVVHNTTTSSSSSSPYNIHTTAMRVYGRLVALVVSLLCSSPLHIALRLQQQKQQQQQTRARTAACVRRAFDIQQRRLCRMLTSMATAPASHNDNDSNDSNDNNDTHEGDGATTLHALLLLEAALHAVRVPFFADTNYATQLTPCETLTCRAAAAAAAHAVTTTTTTSLLGCEDACAGATLRVSAARAMHTLLACVVRAVRTHAHHTAAVRLSSVAAAAITATQNDDKGNTTAATPPSLPVQPSSAAGADAVTSPHTLAALLRVLDVSAPPHSDDDDDKDDVHDDGRHAHTHTANAPPPQQQQQQQQPSPSSGRSGGGVCSLPCCRVTCAALLRCLAHPRAATQLADYALCSFAVLPLHADSRHASTEDDVGVTVVAVAPLLSVVTDLATFATQHGSSSSSDDGAVVHSRFAVEHAAWQARVQQQQQRLQPWRRGADGGGAGAGVTTTTAAAAAAVASDVRSVDESFLSLHSGRSGSGEWLGSVSSIPELPVHSSHASPLVLPTTTTTTTTAAGAAATSGGNNKEQHGVRRRATAEVDDVLCGSCSVSAHDNSNSNDDEDDDVAAAALLDDTTVHAVTGNVYVHLQRTNSIDSNSSSSDEDEEAWLAPSSLVAHAACAIAAHEVLRYDNNATVGT